LLHSGRHGGLADIGGNIKEGTDTVRGHNDNGGSAARFFYCAKASKADRDEGLDGMEERESASTSNGGRPGKVMTVGAASLRGTPQPPPKARNVHPCVKPTALMRYLCRLVTPPGGTVLDPFMGSGSTGKAAVLEGFSFIGIEREAEYVEIAKARIENAKKKYPLGV
jgi:site-specific DNA-methyltransferase (adenine-specific)